MFGTELIQPIIKEVKKLIGTNPQWEVKVIETYDEGALNDFGELGWEPIGLFEGKFIFKRKKIK